MLPGHVQPSTGGAGRKLFNTYPHTHTHTGREIETDGEVELVGRGVESRVEIMWHDNHITIMSRKICSTYSTLLRAVAV